MLSKRKWISVFCALGLVMTTASAWAQDTVTSALDQRALDELKLMSDTISKAATISFETKSMVPVKAPSGIWINLYGDSKVVMQGPDKLFVRTAGDLAPNDFYFDGKNITSYSASKNLFAVRPAPATVEAVIDEAYRDEGKSFPFADILVSEPYSVLTDGLTSAFYVGRSTIGGVLTSHLAFSHQGQEWQIWIGVEDHLPRLVCATYLEDVREPSYTAEFKDWKLNEPVDAQTFVYQNTTNAAMTEFRSPAVFSRSTARDAAPQLMAQGVQS
ncbi:MAG: DUF2092 domain-containing protein [Candidatus Omnitrophica bacterium]|nr:DUF2092 domain-containing protein [Candidatus Omnitrophota bacterium]